MKHTPFLAVLLAASITGCHHPDTVITGQNGASVSVSGDGTHIEGTDANGTKVEENINGNSVSVKDSKGESWQSGSGTVKESDLGVPFYDGSTDDPKSPSMVAEDDKAKTAVSYRTTTDDPDKVVAFYKDKITGAKSSSFSSEGSAMQILSGTLSDGTEITVNVTKKGTDPTGIQLISKKSKKA